MAFFFSRTHLRARTFTLLASFSDPFTFQTLDGASRAYVSAISRIILQPVLLIFTGPVQVLHTKNLLDGSRAPIYYVRGFLNFEKSSFESDELIESFEIYD